MCNDFLKINMHEEKNQFCCLSFSIEKLQHQLCAKEFFKRQYKQNIQTADSVSHLEANVCPQPSIKSRLRKSPAQILCSSVLFQVLHSAFAGTKQITEQGWVRVTQSPGTGCSQGSSRWLSVGWCSVQSVPGGRTCCSHLPTHLSHALFSPGGRKIEILELNKEHSP